MNQTKLFVVIAVTILALFIAGILAMNISYRQRERVRGATATAQVIAGSLALQQTSEAEAMVISAVDSAKATLQSESANATMAAQAESANATATVNAASANATATANAASANAMATAQAATAHENRCRDARFYSFEVAPEPALWPDIGYVYVTDKPWPRVRATWVVTLPATILTDTQSCAWNSVALKTLSGEDFGAELYWNGEPVESVQPGESVEIVLPFPRLQAPDSGEWLLVVNGISLFDHPHLQLDTGDDVWVYIVTPTPTPTLTPRCYAEWYYCNCHDEIDSRTGETKRVCDTCIRTVCE